MYSEIWRPGVLGGIVLFIYSAISWMLLPWNESSLQRFPDEMVVRVAINPIRHAGVYFMPIEDQSGAQQAPAGTPMIFAAVQPGGVPDMSRAMAAGLLNDLLCALIAAWLLTRAPGLNFWNRVCFVVAVGLLAGLATHVSYWNWFGFPTAYTITRILDLALGWFLAGLAMAKVARP